TIELQAPDGRARERGERAGVPPHLVDDELQPEPVQGPELGGVARHEHLLRDAQLEPLGRYGRVGESTLEVRREILVQDVIAQRPERYPHALVRLRAEGREILRQLREDAAGKADRETGRPRHAQELEGTD